MTDLKLVALDLDGTLLDDQKRVSAHNISALKNLLERGVKIALASARDCASIRQVVPVYQPGLYYIASGGTLIYDPIAKQTLWADYLNPGLVEECVLFFKQYGYPVFMNTVDDYWVDRYDARVLLIEERYTLHTELFSTVSDANSKIMRVSLAAPIEILRLAATQAERAFEHRLTVSLASPDWLDLLLPNAGKGALLNVLQNILGISIEQTMAIGDYECDLSLFEQAAHRVAMANAEEIVKKSATYLTASNNQDGVAQAIENYFYPILGKVARHE
jgi:Cof subfamily protein (haloacid dehalogenase superfamily)